ncbi:MAG: tRNA lysidine(34) synthetase TilS [Candidatus Omnitrophota bacterium]
MKRISKIQHTIKRYNLINRGDKIVIGVSGGPDSLALLYILNSIKEELGLSLCVAHLDHKLRKDSKKDLLFVKTIAKKLNLPFTSDEINIKRLAKKGSVEEIAREERLKFLFKSAKKFKANKIALGHTRDDQSETVLMRILRGTGLYGLRGILPKRKINGFIIVRPLIEIERKEIDRYLRKIKVRPRIDSSNLEDIYFRNKVRNRLMPLLKSEYNTNINEILSDMAENIGLDYEYLFGMSLKVFRDLKIKKIRSKIDINIDKFSKFHPAIQRMVIRMAIVQLVGSTRRLNFSHWKELEDLIFRRPYGSIVDLPRRIKAQKDKKRIIISLRNT